MKHLNFRSRFVILLLGFLTLGINQAWGASNNGATLTPYKDNVAGTAKTCSAAGGASSGTIVTDILTYTASGTKLDGSKWTFTSSTTTGTATLTLAKGYAFSKIEITTTTADYCGTWTSSSGTPSTNGASTTISGCSGTSLTLTSTTQARVNTMKIYYITAATDPHTVAFNAGSYGACGTSSLTEASAGAGVILPNVTANEGWKFLGWATTQAKADAGTADAGAVGATYKPSKDITLYAVYKQLYKVTLWRNGSSTTTGWIEDDSYALPTVAQETAACEEWPFKGWSTSTVPSTTTAPSFKTSASKSSTTFYAVYGKTENSSEPVVEEITLTGKTTPSATSFTWSTNKNGGTDPAWSSSQLRLYVKNQLIITSTNLISEIIYTYSINANNSGTKPTGASVTGNNSDNGTWASDTKTWTSSTSKAKTVTLQVNGSAGNYGFTKIKVTTSGGSTTTYTTSPDCAEKYSISSNITGQGSILWSLDLENWSATIANQPENTGIYFKLVPTSGWNIDGTPSLSPTGDIVDYGDGIYGFEMPASAVSVTASFKQPETYIILYDLGNFTDATGDLPDPEEVAPGTNYSVNTTNKLSLTGYTFKGWNTDKNATTGLTNITVNDDITLYAIFTINYHNVIFTPAPIGGSVKVKGIATSPVSIPYNEKVYVIADANTHYTLTTLTANGNSIKDDKFFTMPDVDVTIVAEFTEDTKYDVKFYNNGNEITEWKKEVYVNDPIGTLPTLTSSDAKDARSKTFVGWTEAEITTWQSQAPTLVTSTKVVEGELTLNAVWAKGGNVYDYFIADDNIIETGNYVIEGYNSYDEKDYALTCNINASNYMTSSQLTFNDDDAIENPSEDIVWKLTKIDNNHITIYSEKISKYLNIVPNTTHTKFELSDNPIQYIVSKQNNIDGQDVYDQSWLFSCATTNLTSYQIRCYYESSAVVFRAYNSQTYALYLYKQNISDYITHSSSSPLESITLNTDKVKKNYFVGETFTSANLSATAKLKDGIEFQVEHDALTIEGPDNLSTAGEKTVTVKYTFNNKEQSAEYKVNAYSVTINSVYTDRVDDEPVTGNTYSWTPTTGALTFSTQAHYQFNGITSEIVGVKLNGTKPNYTLSNPTADVTMTATWQRLFTLQYNSKGGGTVPSVTDVTSGTQVETMPSPKLTGYNLVGWYNNDGYTGDAVTFPYAITKDETLFAKWEVKTTEITLSQTDATTKGTEKVIATWGQPMPEATMPQREHYKFAGYKHSNTLYYNADGSSAKNWDKEDAEATLTAQWTINKHNIILPAVLAGGTLSFNTGTSNVSYDATVTITPNPNAHYTLTALTWNGHDILSSKSFQMPDEDVTIEATFTEDPKRTISWSVGGSIAATTNDVYDGTAFATIKANAPAVTDNAAGDCADKFMGWATTMINTPGGIDKDAVQWADEATTSETQNTFYAVFAKGEMSGAESYILVESALTDYSGDYLIVYNNTNAMNTHSGNQNANTFATYTDISSYFTESTKSIASNTTTDALVYRAAKTTNGYSLYCVTDKSYLGITNGTTSTGSKLRWNTSYTESTDDWTLGVGSIGNVGSNTLYIRWNNNSGSYRFAAYAQNGQQAIQLFKKTQIVTYGHYITQCCTTPEHPLEITNTNLTIKTNSTLQLTTTEGNGATKVWASKNGAVATVDQNGIVTPVSTGKATITVSQAATNGFCAQYDEVEIEVIAANEFGISFTAAEGGSTVAKVNDTPTNKATTGTTVTITATPDDDYNFTGWTVNAGGVTLADASKATTTFVMGEADVEITPSFTLKQFTITLNAGNGTVEGGSTKELKNQDIHSTITLPDAVACNSDEWEFKGWAISSVTETTTEPTFVSSTDYEVTKDVTLYAVYGQGEAVVAGYTISYIDKDEIRQYAIGGVNSNKLLPVNPTASNAKVFQIEHVGDGVATSISYDDNGTTKYIYRASNGDFAGAASVPNGANIKTWVVTSNSITGVENAQRGIAGRNISGTVTTAAIKDYDVASIGIGKTYAPIIVEAVYGEGGVWNSNPSCAHHYQVTYDGNGTTTTCASEKLEEGEITLCADEPSLAGYTFAGWNDGTTTYAAGASYNLTAPVTFTAVWNPIKVTAITLNVTEPQTLNWKSDLASAPTFQLSVASTTPAVVADNSVTWSVSEGTAVSVSATGLVTAVEAGTATITATANDGSGVTASCTFTVTKTYKLTITDTEGVKNIKVNTSGSKTQYLESGTEIFLSKTVTQGYTFEAWVVKQGETPITVTDNKFTMPAAEVTVTATFTTKKDYYVDDMNDNEQIVMEGKYTVPSLPDVVTPSSSNSCEQTHLYFVGWIETEISSGQTEVPSGLITAGTEKTAGEKTYHAVWAEDANNNQ